MAKNKKIGSSGRYRAAYQLLKSAKHQTNVGQEQRNSRRRAFNESIGRRERFLAKVASSAGAALQIRRVTFESTHKQGIVKTKRGRRRARLRRKSAPLNHLSDLSIVLEEVDDSLRKAARLKAERRGQHEKLSATTMRSTRNLIIHETENVKAVLAHPAFRSDPLGEVAKRLCKTLGPPHLKKEIDINKGGNPFGKAGK